MWDYPPAETMATMFEPLDQLIVDEMDEWNIGGLSITLYDGYDRQLSRGYGSATAESVFRAGSISKLFSAIAVMQQVEHGRLDLDAPLKYDVPINPFEGSPVTLRQLLSHRSGLQREPAVGSYFDPTEPSLEETCDSILDCVLATVPGSRTRYSNIGAALAGQLAARAAHSDFPSIVTNAVHKPMKMKDSFWLAQDVAEGRLLPATMEVAQKNGSFTRCPAPLFDLGTIPAGNLFTSVVDLGRLLMMLRGDGNLEGEQVLKPETLRAMWEPQFDPEGSYGLGFALGKYRNHRTVGHNGAVYGYSSALVYLPEAQVGVVVLANADVVNARLGRIVNLALSLLLQSKTGESPPPQPRPRRLSHAELKCLAGDYESQSFWATLDAGGGMLIGSWSGQPCSMTPQDNGTFLLNSKIHCEVPVTFQFDPCGKATGFCAPLQVFIRVLKHAPFPKAWRDYVGSYGPAQMPIIVHEKFGHLYAMTENLVDYRLRPINRVAFSLPLGLYTDEQLVFLCDNRGPAPAIDMASVTLDRNPD